MPLVSNAKEIDIDQTDSYTPMPRADYLIMLETFEDKEIEAGRMINCCFVVCDGEYEDRKFYVNYNYEHTNPKTVQIAERDLTRLCTACEIEFDDIDLDEMEMCIGVAFMAHLTIRKSKDERYSDSNNILKYWSEDDYADGVEDGTIKPRTPESSSTASSGTKKPPSKKPAGKAGPAKKATPKAATRKAPPKRAPKKAGAETPFDEEEEGEEEDGIED